MLNIVVYDILFLLYILLLCYNKLNNGENHWKIEKEGAYELIIYFTYVS